MESSKPYLAMLFVQLSYGGLALLSKSAIGGGMNPFVFVVYRQSIAAVFLAPFAYFLERKEAPNLHKVLVCKIFLISLCGITLSSILYYVALRYTSATFAAASTNLIPAITFIMAALLKMERVSIREVDGPAKVVGAVVCMAGALLAAFYQGSPVKLVAGHGHHAAGSPGLPAAHPATTSNGTAKMEWVKGCFIMLAANTIWSLWLTLQVAIVREYPAKMRLAALQCMFSGFQSLALALCVERRPSAWMLGWGARLLSVFYCGVVVTGIAYWLQLWCISIKGPVFATAFNPLGLITAAVFSAILWNEVPFWGSVGGALMMVVGLYMVLWGKHREEVRISQAPQGKREEPAARVEPCPASCPQV